MTTSARNPKVDDWFTRAESWHEEMVKLRELVLATELVEDYKWGQPCYTLDDANVLIIHGFKEYCALLFFKGALMKDPKDLLIQQTKNVQAGRQMRFTSVDEIKPSVVKAYLKEAIAVEKSGAKVEMKETRDFEMVDEFRLRLKELPALQEAFDALTPGRQRAYLLHFAGAKQSATRAARVEKCIPLILDGIGLNDR
ncbi:YdeI family protein [Pelomonas sp. KK5]|uniref:YdeI/OmpD-associated family protein n=1 Tax=Pelomonas sp. KK5 TaxID=1855730 RepID=UPI00097BF561|nr:DUF1801 domain-containing protein [Pelomonas sp. KK5]